MYKDIILCKCHRQPVVSKAIKGKPFNQKKYYYTVTGRQLYNNFIHAKVKINLPDPDDTRNGDAVECPEDLEEAFEDYKKRQGGE